MAAKLSALNTNLEHVELFQIPDIKTLLWDHTSTGVGSKIQFAICQKPRVNIKEKLLQDAVHFLGSSPEGVCVCNFVGSLKSSEGSSTSGVTLLLKKFEEQFNYPGIDNISVPVLVSRKTKGDVKRESIAYLKDLQILYGNCRNQAYMNVKDFFQWYITCSVMGIQCDLKIQLLSVAPIFTITPLHMLPILASELTEFLSKPRKDAIHTGFITVDSEKQFILVPEDLEKLPFLPLVGIWVSGVSSIHNPMVWASCVRYISSSFYQKRLCLPPQPFLLITYLPDEEFPAFYDCIYNSGNKLPEYVLYEGMASTSLPKVKIYDSRSLSVELEEMKEWSFEFEAAVEQIPTHEITPLYCNIVASIDDELPKPPLPMHLEETKLRKLEEINQPFVSELSILEGPNFEMPFVPQMQGFPPNYGANDFNKFGYNSKPPSQMTYGPVFNNSNFTQVPTIPKYIENGALPISPQFMNGSQKMHEQPHFNHREPSFQPGSIGNESPYGANFSKEASINQTAEYFSPIIVNHKHDIKQYVADGNLKYPAYVEKPVYPQRMNSVQQQQQCHRYPNQPSPTLSNDGYINMWDYRKGTTHDQQYFCSASDHMAFQKQARDLRHSPEYFQNHPTPFIMPSNKTASRGFMPQHVHNVFPQRSDSLSEEHLAHKGNSRNEGYDFRNLVTQNAVDERHLAFLNSQQYNHSDPIFEDNDDDLPVFLETRAPDVGNLSTSVSTAARKKSAPSSVCPTSFETSNNSVSQNVNIPTKSCLKKPQSSKSLSCNSSSLSNNSSVSEKKNIQNVRNSTKQCVSVTAERNTSKPTNINRSLNKLSNKIPKPDVLKNGKVISKKNEIVAKHGSKIQAKCDVSRENKTVQSIRSNAESSSVQPHSVATKESKKSASESTEVVIIDDTSLETEPLKSQQPEPLNSELTKSSNPKQLEPSNSKHPERSNSKQPELLKLDQPMRNMDCKITSDSNALILSASEHNITSERSDYVLVPCDLMQSLRERDEKLMEVIKENSQKFDSMAKCILEVLHQSIEINMISSTERIPAIKDKSPDRELEEQMNNIGCQYKTTDLHPASKPSKSSTPNCSDPKSLPKISMSTVNGSLENSPNLRSGDFMFTEKTVTVVKKTCTVSTMTSFIDPRINGKPSAKVNSDPTGERSQKLPLNAIETQKTVDKPCPSEPKTHAIKPLKHKNLLKVRHHVSDSEISKIKHRMDCAEYVSSHQLTPNAQNCEGGQHSGDLKVLRSQPILHSDLQPVRLPKNGDCELLQENADPNIKKHFCNTVDVMEHMLKRANRMSLPNTSSVDIEKKSKKRLSNPGDHKHLYRQSKPKDSKAKLFQNNLTSPTSRSASPCETEDSEIKILRERNQLKRGTQKHAAKKDNYLKQDQYLSMYGLSPSKMSIATKRYMDKFGLRVEADPRSDDLSDS